MSAAQFKKLDEAVHEIRGYVALLNVMKDHLNHNAEASKSLMKSYPDWTHFLLTPQQSFALDFIFNKVIAATDDLTEAFEYLEKP